MRTIAKEKCGCQVIEFADKGDFHFCKLHLTAPDGLALAERVDSLERVHARHDIGEVAISTLCWKELVAAARALAAKAGAK